MPPNEELPTVDASRCDGRRKCATSKRWAPHALIWAVGKGMIRGLSTRRWRTRWQDKSLTTILSALNKPPGQTICHAVKITGVNTCPPLTAAVTFWHRKINYPLRLFPCEKMRAIDLPCHWSRSNARDLLSLKEEMLTVDDEWRCRRTVWSVRYAPMMRLSVPFALRAEGLGLVLKACGHPATKVGTSAKYLALRHFWGIARLV